MKPTASARRMPRTDQEHSRTASAKDASKARRLARQSKHAQRNAA